MRTVLRASIVAGLCLGLGSPAAAAGRGDLPTSRDLQRRADTAARKYDKAVAVLSKLGDDIATLERKIGDADSKMAPLRATVTRRAVAVYTSDRGLDAVAGFAAGADLPATTPPSRRWAPPPGNWPGAATTWPPGGPTSSG
jgi:hypothetical protein